ncbi:MAG: hypothetical protein RLN87_14145 [Parasphingopyxis sp.]|uniref:hypothetical protein n=1 Tax=Parasphingopyxis sp. TaxID=1920299 RepID=UPI0032ECAD08
MEHTVSGLIRRRRELTGDILELLAKVDAITADVEALDRTIRLFDPDMDLDAIPALQHRPQPHWAKHGEVSRAVMELLRQATEPLSTRAVAEAVQQRRGIGDAVTTGQIERVRKCLNRQSGRGTVKRVYVEGTLCWRAG